MRTRHETHFRAQRPDLKEAAPVAALLPIEDADPKGLFLKIVESLRDFERRCVRITRKNGGLNFTPESINCFTSGDLTVGVKRRFNSIPGHLISHLQEIVANI